MSSKRNICVLVGSLPEVEIIFPVYAGVGTVEANNYFAVISLGNEELSIVFVSI